MTGTTLRNSASLIRDFQKKAVRSGDEKKKVTNKRFLTGIEVKVLLLGIKITSESDFSIDPCVPPESIL
jgi:hypothetical protein